MRNRNSVASPLRQMIDARTAFLRKLSLPFRGVTEKTAYVAYELHELKRRSKT